MTRFRAPVIAAFFRFAATLRYRHLFFVAVALFLIDLLVPDLVPFADEILLGLLVLLFGAWRKRDPDAAAVRNGKTGEGEVTSDEPPQVNSRTGARAGKS
jgi:hypothetical protein